MRRRRRSRTRAIGLGLVLAGVSAAAPPPARATWSIVAVDEATREVGIAGASCTRDVSVIGRLVPGRGAVAAQALSRLAGRDQAAAMLAAGASPEEILAALTRPGADGWLLPWHPLRQYGIAALGAAPASYTGAWTIPWRGAAQAAGVTVQGNLLRGPAVVRNALAAFETAGPSCALGERLLRALEAGARAGGDRRCSEEQTARSAFLLVARPGDLEDAPTLRLVVPGRAEDGANPVEELRHLYDGWRALRPDERC